MKPMFKTLMVASVLATAGFAAISQNSGPTGGGMMGEGCSMGHDGKGEKHSMGKMDPAKMEAMMAKRSADLHAKLKITAQQEAAWTAFTASMKPSTSMMNHRPDQAEMAKLSTPERIDKMKADRTKRHADMDTAANQRDEATKAFYAQLTEVQKKTFDAEHASMGSHHKK